SQSLLRNTTTTPHASASPRIRADRSITSECSARKTHAVIGPSSGIITRHGSVALAAPTSAATTGHVSATALTHPGSLTLTGHVSIAVTGHVSVHITERSSGAFTDPVPFALARHGSGVNQPIACCRCVRPSRGGGMV